MLVDIKHFVSGCEVFQIIKDVNQHPQGLLQPLPIPTKKIDTVTMDFITGLPKHSGKNALMVCDDKLEKTFPLSSNLGRGESLVCTQSCKTVLCKLGMVLWCT